MKRNEIIPGRPDQTTAELIGLIDAVPLKDRWRVLIPIFRRLRQWTGGDGSTIAPLLHGFIAGSRHKAETDGAKQTCKVCGCTWNDACEDGCSWIAKDLCSACVPEVESVSKEDGSRKVKRKLNAGTVAVKSKAKGDRVSGGRRVAG
jgi:hypothetical protein